MWVWVVVAGFEVNRVALRELLLGNSGPVARDLSLKAQRVTNAAKRRCPVDTSRLRSSIRFTVISEGARLYALVGSDLHYALFVHEGTRPHWPPPLQPWAKRHGFPAGAAGGWRVAAIIARRGTKARPFLTEALESVGVN